MSLSPVNLFEIFRANMQSAYAERATQLGRGSEISLHRACMPGTVCMDTDAIHKFLKCEVSVVDDGKISPIVRDSRGSSKVPLRINLSDIGTICISHLLGSGSDAHVVQYTLHDKIYKDGDPKYALKVCHDPDFKTTFLERACKMCIFMRELYDAYITGAKGGQCFPFLPSVFVPAYGVLSYSGEQTSTQWREQFAMGTYEVQVLCAMLAALQLLETKDKVLPDGKIDNVVTLTVENKVTACVIDWDGIVDGWSDIERTIHSTFTPPGAMCIRDALRKNNDPADLSFLKYEGCFVTNDPMGYLSSYFMIGCVFTAAVALWDSKNQSLFWYDRDTECCTRDDQMKLEVQRVTYMTTQTNKKNQSVLCLLAMLLEKFKGDTMECIEGQKPSRSYYIQCLADMLAVCETPAIHEEARDYSVPTNSTSRNPTKRTGRFTVTAV